MLKKNNILMFFILLPFCIWLPAYFFFKMYIPNFATPHGVSGYFILLLLSPLLEEIVFRGLLQDILLRWFRQQLLGVLILNLAFAGLHYRINASLLYLFPVFICGLIFSIVKIRFASLVYPILFHIYYNAFFVVMLGLR